MRRTESVAFSVNFLKNSWVSCGLFLTTFLDIRSSWVFISNSCQGGRGSILGSLLGMVVKASSMFVWIIFRCGITAGELHSFQPVVFSVRLCSVVYAGFPGLSFSFMRYLELSRSHLCFIGVSPDSM